MNKLVLIRHGQSTWNRDDRFTGWTDVPLTEKGVREATDAAGLLKKADIAFDAAHTSLLSRAIKTLWIVLEHMDLMWIPVYRSWRLNERHYGALQGLSKSDMRKQHGEDQVHQWRRAYAVRPPALTADDSRFPGSDRRYADLAREELPRTESLEDTTVRCLPYWHNAIAPMLAAGRCVLVAAHGNSLRALVKYLDDIPDQDISNVEIPTGKPLVYEFQDDGRPLRSYYLGDNGDHGPSA